MTDKDIETLESLLIQLWSKLGHRYIITPCFFGENIQITTYDSDGNKIKVATGPDLKTALRTWYESEDFEEINENRLVYEQTASKAI